MHDRHPLMCELKMTDDTHDNHELPLLQEPRLWQNEKWTAKKNPKPLDGNAFITLVKTASEFVRRSEQQLHAQLHQSVTVNGHGPKMGRVTVLLDIVPDEDSPYAMLSAQDEGGDVLADIKVEAGFKLNRQSAQAWVDAEFAKPGSGRR